VQLRRANPGINTFFRVCTTDSRQGSAAAQFARSLGFRTVYVVDDNETYGLDIANVFESDFRKLGGNVLAHDHIASNTQDFKALLLKIAATKPDLLFFGGVTSTGGGLIRKQMFDTGMSAVPFMGGDGLADLATVAKNFSDGSYYTVAAPKRIVSGSEAPSAPTARMLTPRPKPQSPLSKRRFAKAATKCRAGSRCCKTSPLRMDSRRRLDRLRSTSRAIFATRS
jgi:ABC-type branched-subunit amino acid transport system substrate-binding protein